MFYILNFINLSFLGTTSIINESISTFKVTTPLVSHHTNVSITPETAKSVLTHRGRGRPPKTPLTTNSSEKSQPKTRTGRGRPRKNTGVESSDINLDTTCITHAIPTSENTYSSKFS